MFHFTPSTEKAQKKSADSQSNIFLQIAFDFIVQIMEIHKDPQMVNLPLKIL